MSGNLLSISDVARLLRKTDRVTVTLAEASETLAEGLKRNRQKLVQVIGASLGGATVSVDHRGTSSKYHIKVESRPASKKRDRSKKKL